VSSYEDFFGAWELKEVRSFHAPVRARLSTLSCCCCYFAKGGRENITSCNRSVDFGVKKYVIF
jgi:hypothetical protein